MHKPTLRFVLAIALVAAVLFGGVGSALAFLSPSNPDVLLPNPDAAHMPTSYTADHIPLAPPAPTYADPGYVIGPGSVPDYLTTPNWAYSPPLQKFVDPLPNVCVPTAASGWANCDAAAVGMDKNIPIAVPDIVSYPGSDYYELELVEFQEPMHSDLLTTPTTLRGYRQVGKATDTSNGCTDPALDPANAGGTNCQQTDNIAFPVNPKAHYLGPIIIAAKDRPVRVKFINSLPTGAGGKLFVPVDTTIMGAGAYDVAYDSVTKQPVPGSVGGNFAENRAELHLHGGRTPWISDGTPHQWITPAGEPTDYPKGVSVENVPDMEDPGSGAQTYFWTNQQSSRMMFYHDHSWGITRVNVYVGEAAGYLIRDDAEQALIDGGIIPGVKSDGVTLSYGGELPLVIQDKTFVDATTITATDPTWAWGTQPWDGTPGAPMTPVTGDLWWPHIYMPAQNPFDITGIAPMGRWAYGPYFWPATQNEFQPVPNPYYHPDCDPADPTTPGSKDGFCQPFEIPSTPNPSWGAEAFMDTPVVNGTAYPTVTVEPKPYRLRILNAAHDRFFNLSMFIAAKNTSQTWAEGTGPVALCDATNADPTCTEVKMLPAVVHPGFPATWPADGRPGGVPDYATKGPDWIMIGTEGGFLPQPVVIPPNPVNWNADVTTFNAGNVNTGSLILGPAERADVIVDFSQYAGKTLILYNDAPAPWPALDPHYDYYTDPALDNTGMGGAGPTLPGFGPNTRTVMQIRVGAAGAQAFDLAALQTAFDPPAGAPGVFRQSQDPIIVAQGNMNPQMDPARFEAFAFDTAPYAQDFSAYNRTYDPAIAYPTNFPYWGIARINDQTISFKDINGNLVNNVPLEPKAIQDEQGETFDQFGRMRAGLGLQITNRLPGQVGFVVQTYSDPSTEILQENGIQVWKITHNGVDTHPVHFHLFDVQVLNRVGWDGFIRLPDPTELGWKDTVRISPLEDTIVAIKPVTPKVPFGIPESVRPKNPGTSLGSNMELTQINPADGQARLNLNEIITLDWEYVWHCHILSHEENDMMRPISFQFVEALPDAPASLQLAAGNAAQVTMTWTDPTPVNDPATLGNPKGEIGFRIERNDGGGFVPVGSALANATSFTDTTVAAGATYDYQVIAYNAAGDSLPSNTATITALNYFNIAVSTGAGGSISPAGPNVAVAEGADQIFNITPNAGYHVVDVVVDGVSLGALGAYNFAAVNADHTIAVSFLPNTRTITVTAGAGGSISPAGPAVTVTYGADQPFTITPNVGSIISDVLVDGVSQGAIAAYTFTNVTADHTIAASFQDAVAGAVATLTVPSTSSDGSIALTWTASSTPGVTYVLYESLNGGAFAQVASTTATSTTLNGRANGTYTYQIKATLAGSADSALTNGSNACVVALTVQPVATLTVPATSQDGNIALTWTASPTPGVTYVLYESKNGGAYAIVTSTAATGVTLAGRTNGTHAYRIRATLAGWADSTLTNGSNPCVVTLTVQPPPSLTVPPTSSNGSIALTWAASPTAGVTYYLYESRNGGAYVLVAATAATSRTMTGRTNGTYNYRITALKAGWVTSVPTYGSNACVVLLTVQPVAMLTVPASSIDGNVALSWPASPTTSVIYAIYESKDGGAFTQVATTTVTTRTLTGRTNGTYTYRIVATRSGWVSSTPTNGSNACVVLLTVKPPSNLLVPAAPNVTTGTVTLTWTASPTVGATYVIYESKDGGAFTQVGTALSGYKLLPCRAAGTYAYQVKAVKPGWVDSSPINGNRNCVSTRLTCP